MNDTVTLETSLGDVHRAMGAQMVEFGGWNMPMRYSSIREEHVRTRTSASIFDVGHMGRIKLTGPDADRAIERLCPLRIGAIGMGQSHYTFLLTEEGTTIDDLLVTREMDGLALVLNASNRVGDLEWMKDRTSDLDILFLDMTEETAMIAVQGPLSPQFVGQLTTEDPADLPYYHARVEVVDGQLGIVSRTGYTGEDGFELTVPAGDAGRIWENLLQAGGDQIGPAGLGARDTLRLEAAMPLYGHELGGDISPLEAGLKRFVDLENETFIGRAATVSLRENGLRRKCVCLRGNGRKVARDGATLRRDGEVVGKVTSGTFSPTFEVPIAMGLVDTSVKRGQVLQADVRDKSIDLEVIKRPFYKRP